MSFSSPLPPVFANSSLFAITTVKRAVGESTEKRTEFCHESSGQDQPRILLHKLPSHNFASSFSSLFILVSLRHSSM